MNVPPLPLIAGDIRGDRPA